MESSIPLRRFEFKDDKSYKFWSIELDGSSHTVTFGRIGTKGQTSTKAFADAPEAQGSYKKLIGEKVRKGYNEVKKPPATAKKTAAEIRQERELHEPFEQAIIADPDDLAAYAVYSDWLTERNDPRGQFMQIQLSLEDPQLPLRRRAELKKQEKSMLARHARNWLGDLTPFLIEQKGNDEGGIRWNDSKNKCFEYTFEGGVLWTILMRRYSHQLGAALRDSTHARLLRSLTIEETPDLNESVPIDGPEVDRLPNLATLLGARLDNLRYFRLGVEDEGQCRASGEHAVKLIRCMPNIEAIRLRAHHVGTAALFRTPLPRLRSLTLRHQYTNSVPVLAKNSTLTNLETLKFHPHALETWHERAYLRLEDFRAIARSPHLEKLTHLVFRCSDMGDAGIEELISSGLLGRLKTLDLGYGCVTDRGAELLVTTPELKQLDELNLTGNALTQVGVALLKSARVHLEAGVQFASRLGYREIRNPST